MTSSCAIDVLGADRFSVSLSMIWLLFFSVLEEAEEQPIEAVLLLEALLVSLSLGGHRQSLCDFAWSSFSECSKIPFRRKQILFKQ